MLPNLGSYQEAGSCSYYSGGFVCASVGMPYSRLAPSSLPPSRPNPWASLKMCGTRFRSHFGPRSELIVGIVAFSSSASRRCGTSATGTGRGATASRMSPTVSQGKPVFTRRLTSSQCLCVCALMQWTLLGVRFGRRSPCGGRSHTCCTSTRPRAHSSIISETMVLS